MLSFGIVSVSPDATGFKEMVLEVSTFLFVLLVFVFMCFCFGFEVFWFGLVWFSLKEVSRPCIADLNDLCLVSECSGGTAGSPNEPLQAFAQS